MLALAGLLMYCANYRSVTVPVTPSTFRLGDKVLVTIPFKRNEKPLELTAICERLLPAGEVIIAGTLTTNTNGVKKQIWLRGTVPSGPTQQSAIHMFHIDSLRDVTLSSDGPIEEPSRRLVLDWFLNLFDQ